MRELSGPMGIETLTWDDGLFIIDQTLLPTECRTIRLDSLDSVAEAIRSLRIRGAPAIGCAAAYGLCVCAFASDAVDVEELRSELHRASRVLAGTRPTAVNLFWALDRMGQTLDQPYPSTHALCEALLATAHAIRAEDDAACRQIGRLGAQLVPDGAGIITHCNAGGLATSGYGTAIGVIRAAYEAGKAVHVFVDETRPLLQGARLTAWELKTLGIPATLSCDVAAATHLAGGAVQLAITGADRIASNGDVANKVGTLGLAILCRHFGVPFYVAAPLSTFDGSLAAGSDIPIEQRPADEVVTLRGVRVAPEPEGSLGVSNPAFDVTPAELITAIVTERGILRPPYPPAIARVRREGWSGEHEG